MIVKHFRARRLPVTLLRRKTRLVTARTWHRLHRHIAAHAAAGGYSLVIFEKLAEPVRVRRGVYVVEVADVYLSDKEIPNVA